MKLKHLKTVRVVVSLVLLAVTSVLFLDVGTAVTSRLSPLVVPFQIVPALTKSVGGFGLWTIGAAVVLLLTLAFGRVYCSSICPLGTFQDVVIRLAERARGKRRFRYAQPKFLWHYGLLALIALLFLGGNLLLLNLLEPFSNYGRMLQALVRPAVIAGNNGIAYVLGLIDVYAVFQVAFHPLNIGVMVSALSFLGVVAYLSFTRGRLFCNLLCPAGALLGLISRVSFVRLVIDPRTCKECGLCEKVCKASCIDSKRLHLDYSACVNCFNCVHVCPTVGLKYVGLFTPTPAKEALPVDKGRRRFLAGSLTSMTVLVGLGTDTLVVPPAERQKHPVTPPGSVSIEHFTARCTACHLCVSACPTRVLNPTFLEYGVRGVLQPKMDYWANYCNYECTVCGTVCPTGAILPVPVEQKKLIQMGKVHFVKDECIVVTKKKDCGACSEHCPTKAVRMVPYEQKLMIPETDNEICVGCGACEHACPTLPYKAIYVESNVVHLQAKKPPVEKPEKPKEEPVEFPF
jgi:ferredoxin